MKRALVLLAMFLAACTKPAPPEKGQRVSCECKYLTDYDDTARVGVDVCVPAGANVDQAARACAAESAHNHIEQCVCGALGEACVAAGREGCRNR